MHNATLSFFTDHMQNNRNDDILFCTETGSVYKDLARQTPTNVKSPWLSIQRYIREIQTDTIP